MKHFALIGFPLGHSLSAKYFAEKFSAEGIDADYTPLPYKLFTITGGLFGINLPMFVVASIVSRGLRFFLVAGLIWKFGAPIKTFIDKYFNWLAIAFTVLLIGAFVLVGKFL